MGSVRYNILQPSLRMALPDGINNSLFAVAAPLEISAHSGVASSKMMRTRCFQKRALRKSQTNGRSPMPDDREDKTIYKVVVNHEEQYSIWPVSRENALGWNDAGKSGTKEECLAYINEVWTDMRPLSLRKIMQEQGQG
jgi:MbtH protein